MLTSDQAINIRFHPVPEETVRKGCKDEIVADVPHECYTRHLFPLIKAQEQQQMKTIEQLVKDYVDDVAVVDYLVQILSDPDAYSDEEGLIETLQSFLNDDDPQAVATRLVKELSKRVAPVQDAEASVQEKATTLSSQEPSLLRADVVVVDPLQSVIPEGDDAVPSQPTFQTSPKSKKERRTRKKTKTQTAVAPLSTDDADDSWQSWGGRGKGGRGEYASAVNSIQSNIHLSNVSLSLDNGMDLLVDSTMDILKGHRYGLIGRNACGKSTLLRRLALRAIPGMPNDMRILLVQQQIEGSESENSLETLLKADVYREMLLREQEQAESRLEEDQVSSDEIEKIAERLGEIVGELEAISADTAEARALDILHGLQFTEEMIYGPTKQLSGGWRMRLALARALFVPSDLILFDECTNHLDLFGLEWLIQYINNDMDRTLIVVSHDRSFLDAVCTDICVLEHQRLSYHPGNFSEYERQMEEKAAREAQILDAAERQQTKAKEFIQKQQAMSNKKKADPNKQRQAKMIKEKKLDRIGNYREDGKRYKTNSLKKLSEDYLRTAQKVIIEKDEAVVKMYFPTPMWPPSIAPNDAIVRLEEFSFAFDADRPLLDSVTLCIERGSKIAIVGQNGSGKSTLVNLLSQDLNPRDFHTRGSLWVHPNIRIGHVTQYAVEEMQAFENMTVVQYAEERLRSGKASAEIVAKASGNVRQYLGAFGLGGRHALQTIGKLSGGERMRLCFATVLAEQPHLLFLDESTNHVDIETLDSMSDALNAFEGSVVMVSHNQSFLSGFCNELWVVEGGKVAVTHSDTETFDEIFSSYRSTVLGGGKKSLSQRRRQKAEMAKQATKQRSGARQNAVLL